jgi:hypothetical protein
MPILNCLFSLSRAFQLIPGFALSVLIPNFTDSPGLIDSDDVKIITPCGVFSPTHAFSVLKDLKLKSLPSQILKVLISLFESFVNSIIVVSSRATLFTIISSAYAFDGITISNNENNNVILNLKVFFLICYFLIQDVS